MTAPRPDATASEMTTLVRTHAWNATVLGPPETWPTSLRLVVDLLLGHPLPMVLLWGEDLALIYNDGYRALMGAKHPGGLGQPNRDVWPEAWDFTRPICERVLRDGDTLQFVDQHLVLRRHGYDEDTYFTLSYSPVRDEAGRVAGVLVTVIETTDRVLAERSASTRQAEIERRNTALEAFAVLTRDLAAETHRTTLVRRAQEILLSLLPPGVAFYYELDGDLWRLKSQVGDAHNENLQHAIDAGLPFEATHNLRMPWLSGQPYYQDAYDVATDSLPEITDHIGATATLPILVRGEPVGVLAVAVFQQRAWTSTDRAVLATTMHNLGLALERADVVRRLEENAKAQEAFVAYTEAVGSESDPLEVVRRAVSVTRVNLQHVSVAYYTREDDLWKARAWSDDLAEDVVQQIRAGVPVNAPNFLEATTTASGVFVDGWDAEANSLPSTTSYGAVALLPIRTSGHVNGVLAVGTRAARTWTEQEKGVVRAVARSLELAFERARDVEALAERTRALERSNAELEQFAYVASHDLQAPIRAVTSFADLIERRYGHALDERGLGYLRHISDGGRHMKRLVDDLLAFSRLHTEQRPFGPVSANDVFDAVVARLAPDIEAADGQVKRGALPSVLADAAQFDSLLQNLVSNGLKYARAGVSPRVRVTAKRDGRWWRFSVSDNGIGIEEAYFDKIFVIFQRLHGREQFEGTGIGLAVCKKIVERHGGRIWLDSVAGEGTTFHFTLPRA